MVRCGISNYKMLPRLEMSVQRAKKAAILEVLGPMTDAGVAATPVSREVKRAVNDTSTTCVTLNFSNDTTKARLLSLNLGLENGIEIKNILYAPRNVHLTCWHSPWIEVYGYEPGGAISRLSS